MLITFVCDAHESLTMFGNVGTRLLDMMGYHGKPSGEISEKDIPAARERLRSGIENDTSPLPSENEDDNDSDEPLVSLKHRAFPLFEMLDAAEKEKCNVKWKTV